MMVKATGMQRIQNHQSSYIHPDIRFTGSIIYECATCWNWVRVSRFIADPTMRLDHLVKCLADQDRAIRGVFRPDFGLIERFRITRI